MKIYNKLVRDKIPEIMISNGVTPVTETLNDVDYIAALEKKLNEEVDEYHNDKNIEELADLLELIRAATIARGYTLEELEAVRANKAEKRGRFKQKILLIETIEK